MHTKTEVRRIIARKLAIKRYNTGLRYMNIMLMIVLTALTYGFFVVFWLLWQRDALNKLNSVKKIPIWSIILLALLLIAFVNTNNPEIILSQYSSFNFEVASNWLSMLFTLVNGLIGIRIKQILEDHFKMKMSSFIVFFFSPYLLQYEINSRVGFIKRS
jgi:hypothetical protein